MATLSIALKQLQKEHSRVSAQLKRINRALDALKTNHTPGKRRLSASAIARIRAAQKTRWAKWRKAQKTG
jgi:hypothetical protein